MCGLLSQMSPKSVVAVGASVGRITRASWVARQVAWVPRWGRQVAGERYRTLSEWWRLMLWEQKWLEGRSECCCLSRVPGKACRWANVQIHHRGKWDFGQS